VGDQQVLELVGNGRHPSVVSLSGPGRPGPYAASLAFSSLLT
jgi:hypothetical protein